jgi:nucleoid-associated protein YgaU
MARRNNKPVRKTTNRSETTVKVTRPAEKADQPQGGMFEKIQYDLQHNQSYLNLILGGLIVVVLGVLVYNYFTRPTNDLGSSEQMTAEETQGDVAKTSLPGKYTIKQGDTLFTIAQNYYDDGLKYTEIVKANGMANENQIEVGQEITIPKIETATAEASTEPSMSPNAMTEPSVQPSASVKPSMQSSSSPATMQMETNQVDPSEKGAMGGAENQTIWGEKITGNTYTVQPGDWLSKVAGRAYGDVMAYQKIAQANKITNPDTIEVGTVLQLPR